MHDLFITSLAILPPPPSRQSALAHLAGSGAPPPSAPAPLRLITCAGDNTVSLTPLPPKALARRGAMGSLTMWLSLLVILYAYAVAAYPALAALLLPQALQPLVASMGGAVPPPSAPLSTGARSSMSAYHYR